MDRIARAILSLQGAAAYALIFVLPALEASVFAGFLIPGELAVLLGGVLAFHGRVSLAGAIVVAAAGAVTGDAIGYLVGARYGERLLGARLVRRLVKPRHRERAEELIRRRGAPAVFFGRLSAVLRVLVPGLAGMSRMPFGRFLFFNVLGGVVWAGGVTLIGYAAGNAWRRAAAAASKASALLAVVLVVVVTAVFGARWLVRHEEELRAWWARRIEQPRIVALRARYARQLEFARERIDPRGAFGLYLTLGLAVTVAAAWALGAALQDLIAHEELVLIDRPVDRFVEAHRAPMVGDLMKGISLLGRPGFVALAVVVAALVAIRRAGTIRPGIYLLATGLGGLGMEHGLRTLVHRAGMFHSIAEAAGPSFPSAHTVAAVTAYGGIAFAVSRYNRSWRVRVWVGVAAAVVVILVAVSRVYLGDHLASGVVAAGALGATWLAVTSTAWMLWERLGEHPGLREARNRVVSRTLRWGLTVVSLGIALHFLLLALPGMKESAATLRHAHGALVVLAVGLEAASLACLGQVYRYALAALGARIPYRDAERISLGMFTVARIMPVGGAAAGVWGGKELTGIGVDPARAMSSVALGGGLAMATLGGIVFVGAAASLTRGEISPQYAAAIAVTLLVLAAIGAVVWRAARSAAFRDRIFRLVEGVLARFRIRTDLTEVRRIVEDLVRNLEGGGGVRHIIRWSAANWLLDIGALWMLFFAFGRHVHLGVVVVGYGVANLVTALPLTPGGIGLVEAGLAATYTAFGVPGSVAVVVVLAYRLLSFWLPVLVGLPAYLGAGRRTVAPVEATR